MTERERERAERRRCVGQAGFMRIGLAVGLFIAVVYHPLPDGRFI
jgi:hypothetical protein